MTIHSSGVDLRSGIGTITSILLHTSTYMWRSKNRYPVLRGSALYKRFGQQRAHFLGHDIPPREHKMLCLYANGIAFEKYERKFEKRSKMLTLRLNNHRRYNRKGWESIPEASKRWEAERGLSQE